MGDPFRLPGMDKAVERIWKAIQDETPIVVYGDYDVDGVTSAALMSLVPRISARESRGIFRTGWRKAMVWALRRWIGLSGLINPA